MYLAMNFKAIITVGIVTLSGATLALTHLSTQAQAQSKYNRSNGIKDVTLFSKGMNKGRAFASDKGVADLSTVGFDDKAVAIQVNNGQKWRFYVDKNFQGEFIEIGPEEGRGFIGKFTRRISSFKSVK
jgi:hypothetical protein